jgi:hypothetical protein
METEWLKPVVKPISRVGLYSTVMDVASLGSVVNYPRCECQNSLPADVWGGVCPKKNVS